MAPRTNAEARGAEINERINALRTEISNLEIKENAEQKKIDRATAAKAKLTNELIDKKTQQFEQLEEFHNLYKLHLDGIDQTQKQKEENLAQREAALADREAAHKGANVIPKGETKRF